MSKAPATCQRIDCTCPATWQVGFRAWAFGAPKVNRNALEAWMGLAICEEHKGGATVKDVVSPEAVSGMCAMLLQRGRAPIDPQTIEVQFRKIHGGMFYMPGMQ